MMKRYFKLFTTKLGHQLLVERCSDNEDGEFIAVVFHTEEGIRCEFKVISKTAEGADRAFDGADQEFAEKVVEENLKFLK